jgi:hypothetical protein
VLSAGIIIMVAALLIGVIALTLVALMSSSARTAGRRTRVAMGLSDPEEGALSYDRRPGEGAAYHQADAPYPPAEEDASDYPAEEDASDYPAEQEVRDPGEADASDYPAEQEVRDPGEGDAPYYAEEREVGDHPAEAEAPAGAEAVQPARWVLALLVVSGAGLAVGLLMVVIGSIS